MRLAMALPTCCTGMYECRGRQDAESGLFEPEDFSRSCASCARDISASVHVIARLAALAPRPRAHLVRYHGLFAPNARERPGIVARPKQASKPATDDEPQPGVRTTPMRWMARLHRVFAIDLSRCPRCGGSSQVIGAITEPGVIARILEHIGLDGRVQPRAPPQALAS